MSSDDEMEDMSGDEAEVELDLTNSDVVTKYKAAADIANKSLLGVISQCVAGKNVADICAFGDQIVTAQCDGKRAEQLARERSATPRAVLTHRSLLGFSQASTRRTRRWRRVVRSRRAYP